MTGINMVQCSRCGRRVSQSKAVAENWNVTAEAGRIVGYLCSTCQTPEENAEAEINLATLDYASGGTTDDGRLDAKPKLGEDGE